jgi:hypothetical protein
MNDRLEKFVKNNREDFDKFEPGPVVWHNIQQQLTKVPPQKGVYISMRVLRWSAAAAVVILLGIGGFFVVTNSKKISPELAGVQPGNSRPVTGVTSNDTAPSMANSTVDVTGPVQEDKKMPPALLPATVNESSIKKATRENEQKKNSVTSSIDKEMMAYEQSTNHFAKLITLKQSELKGLAKTNPNLYKEFVNDIHELDLSYKSLKKQLPLTTDRSRLIKAMIDNLQWQIDLLNKQLIIVNQIESKQKATNYERSI